MNQLEEVAHDFIQLFEKLNIPYALMGGFAVRAHAIPRPTYDVDFTVALKRDRLHELYTAAKARGYEIPEAQESGWIESVKGLSLVKFKWHTVEGNGSFDVDVFLAENAFHQQMLDRRQRHAYGSWEAWFVSPEDLILLKVFADRMKDKVDVLDVLFTQGQLDVNYMRKWARRLNISERLEQALNQ